MSTGEPGDVTDGPIDPSILTNAWSARWPNCRPIGHELRDCAHDRWVRFHSLPGSKRYAETDDEYAELLGRHNTVIDELLSLAGPDEPALVVLTCSWSGSSAPVRLESAVEDRLPEVTYWRSILREVDAGWESWVHLYVGRIAWRSGVLDELLTLIADDAPIEVIVGPPDLAWLYHPYDGGADVIAPDPVQRDVLRERHATWLSPYPHGR